LTFLANLILGVVAAVISALLAPRPPAPKPADLDDFDIPRAEEGVEIGIAYGSPWIKSAQVAWFGDFKSSPIKSSGGKK
jgi:hypothetical protein